MKAKKIFKKTNRKIKWVKKITILEKGKLLNTDFEIELNHPPIKGTG